MYEQLKTNDVLNFLDKVVEMIESFKTDYVARTDNNEQKNLTANQKRAALIEKAKRFLEEQKISKYLYNFKGNKVSVDFYREKNRVTCVVNNYHTGYTINVGRAECMDADVFNEYIGQAIALARALEVDVPDEFLKAVQPDNAEIGMLVRLEKNYPYAIPVPLAKGELFLVTKNNCQKKGECHMNSPVARNSIIIDDTNAEFEVNTDANQ